MDIAVNTSASGRWRLHERPEDADWDWEAARVDGKLIRFGYQPDCVLVLVLTLARPKAPDRQP
jgi:hypothetical protein